MPRLVALVFAAAVPLAQAFLMPYVSFRCARFHFAYNDPVFSEDEEMIPVAKNYISAKYRAVATSKGRASCNKDDAKDILRSILPPVTAEELNAEIETTMSSILKDGNAESIDEGKFVDAIMGNSYWRAAGDLVVKELMYFDALYSYYRTGKSFLNDDDYGVLKENLTWEGSAVANMNKKEALFVTAVASSRRGEPIMDDEEYTTLKNDLKEANSWVTNREPDALEKLGLNTFMGYLHRAL